MRIAGGYACLEALENARRLIEIAMVRWITSIREPGKPLFTLGLLFLACLHVLLLGYSATVHSPTTGELPALAAGVRHWTTGEFDLFRVNPPLVRLVASLPAVCMGAQTDWSHLQNSAINRQEFQAGERFIAINSKHWLSLYIAARWACIPFSLLGMLVCFCWAKELYGSRSGILAAILWCFCPNILGYASVIMPDAAAAALGGAAAYSFWRWLKVPNWSRASIAGIALGLAELTKFTWCVLFLVWPLLWCGWILMRCSKPRWAEIKRTGPQVLCISIMALYAINLGYGFRSSGKALGDFVFVSRALAGSHPIAGTEGGNRFADTWLAAIPVPFPADYVLGIDLQKRDFESGHLSYLRGEWREPGWWYYYLYGLSIKLPIGSLCLLSTAFAMSLLGKPSFKQFWNGVVLWTPALVVLMLVSSQTGLNAHFRYVLPILPFCYVGASKLANAITSRGFVVAVFSLTALAAIESLSVYPHSLSFFNRFVGGPLGGPKHLLGSATDYGQDLLFLKAWIAKHPEAHPLGLSAASSLDPRIIGIDSEPVPRFLTKKATKEKNEFQHMGPLPGWYAISVNRIHSDSDEYSYFLKFNPTARAGYSIYIYHITLDEANRVRRELELQELPKE